MNTKENYSNLNYCNVQYTPLSPMSCLISVAIVNNAKTAATPGTKVIIV